MSHVLEIVYFSTKEEFTKSEIIELAAKMDEELKTEIPGFVNRRLVSNSDNEWVDIVEWESQEQSLSAIEIALTKQDCLAFFNTIKEDSTKMEHYLIEHSI